MGSFNQSTHLSTSEFLCSHQVFFVSRREKHVFVRVIVSHVLLRGPLQAAVCSTCSTMISFRSLSWKFCSGSMKFCLTLMSSASFTSAICRMASPMSTSALPGRRDTRNTHTFTVIYYLTTHISVILVMDSYIVLCCADLWCLVLCFIVLYCIVLCSIV